MNAYLNRDMAAKAPFEPLMTLDVEAVQKALEQGARALWADNAPDYFSDNPYPSDT